MSLLARWWGDGVSHSVGASRLGAEDEQCDNQHEVEGVESRQRGERYKG